MNCKIISVVNKVDYSPYKVVWQIPELILKASMISFNALLMVFNDF